MPINAVFEQQNKYLGQIADQYVDQHNLQVVSTADIISAASLVRFVDNRVGESFALKIVRPLRAEQKYPSLYHHFGSDKFVKLIDVEQRDDGVQIQFMERAVSNSATLADVAKESAYNDIEASRIICKAVKKIHSVSLGDFDISTISSFDDRLFSVLKHLKNPNLPKGIKTIFEKAVAVHQKMAHDYAGRFVLGHGDNHHYNILHDNQRQDWLLIDAIGLYAPEPYHVATLGFNPFDSKDDCHSHLPLKADRMIRQCETIAAEFGCAVESAAEAIWLNCLHVAALRCGVETVANQAGYEYFMKVAKNAEVIADINLPNELYDLPNFVAPQ